MGKNIKKAKWSMCELVMQEAMTMIQPPSIDHAEAQMKKQEKQIEDRLKAEQERKRKEYELKTQMEENKEKQRLEEERLKAEQEKDAMRRELEATKAKMVEEEQKRKALEEETKKLREEQLRKAKQSQLPQPVPPNQRNWGNGGLSVEDALAHKFEDKEATNVNDSSSDGYTSSSDYTTDSEYSGSDGDEEKRAQTPSWEKKKKKKKQ